MRLTTPATDVETAVRPHVAVVERVAEHRAEHEHQSHERVEQTVDRPFQRGSRVPEGACLADDPGGEALRPHSAHQVGPRALDGEHTGVDALAHPTGDRLGLSGQHRLVQSQVVGLQHLAVGNYLIARSQTHEIAGHDFPDRDLAGPAVAHHLCSRRDQQGQAVKGSLGADLLCDTDRRVGHDHAQEQGVAPVAERQRYHPEGTQDHVEHRQDIRPHDAPVGATTCLLGDRPQGRETGGRISLAEPALQRLSRVQECREERPAPGSAPRASRGPRHSPAGHGAAARMLASQASGCPGCWSARSARRRDLP